MCDWRMLTGGVTGVLGGRQTRLSGERLPTHGIGQRKSKNRKATEGGGSSPPEARQHKTGSPVFVLLLHRAQTAVRAQRAGPLQQLGGGCGGGLQGAQSPRTVHQGGPSQVRGAKVRGVLHTRHNNGDHAVCPSGNAWGAAPAVGPSSGRGGGGGHKRLRAPASGQGGRLATSPPQWRRGQPP